MKERFDRLKKEGTAKLAAYKAAHHLQPTVSSSGLQYEVRTEGVGAPAHTGDTVAVRYTVRLMSGRLIYSVTQEPRLYMAGLNSTIRGLEEAMLLFPAQTKVTLIIPSALAFGENGMRVFNLLRH